MKIIKKLMKNKNNPYHKVFIGNQNKMDDDTIGQTNGELRPESGYNKNFIGKIDKFVKEDGETPKHHAYYDMEAMGLVDELHHRLKKHYDFGENLINRGSRDDDDPHRHHKEAIETYTGSSYRNINKPLYKGEEVPETYKKTVDDLKSALKVHKTPDHMVVHSGLKRDPREMAVHEGQIKMEMPAFTSTSISPTIARGFAKTIPEKDSDGVPMDWGRGHSHVVHIHVPAGSHGAYVDHHSNMETEQEFTLHPGARIHVHPVPEIEKRNTYDVHHWHGTLVHDGVKDLKEMRTLKDKLIESAKGLKEVFDPEAVKIANSTSRNSGAIGAKAITPKYVAAVAQPHHKILDFGSGKDAAHAKTLRTKGFHVTAHEFGDNQNENHDPEALTRQYDHVFASNVLNVQGSKEMMGHTLDQIHKATKKGGAFTGNFPESPRKAADIDASHVEMELAKRFHNVKRVGGTKKAPLFHATEPR
jgi:hypothetical protein